MERQPVARWGQKEKRISLHSVIDNLLMQTSTYAARQGNVISNDIEYEIPILTDFSKVRQIVKKVLELILTVANKSHVHISAKTFTDLVLVHFKQDNVHNISLLFNELKKMLAAAEEIGGVIGITTHQDKFTTISFTFLNAKKLPDYSELQVKTNTYQYKSP